MHAAVRIELAIGHVSAKSRPAWHNRRACHASSGAGVVTIFLPRTAIFGQLDVDRQHVWPLRSTVSRTIDVGRQLADLQHQPVGIVDRLGRRRA